MCETLYQYHLFLRFYFVYICLSLRLQNPLQRPMIGTLVPTLLKDGLIYCMQNPAISGSPHGFEERPLLGKAWTGPS